MKLKNISKILSIGAIAFIMTGCGGGSSSSGGDTPPPSTPPPSEVNSPFDYVSEYDGVSLRAGTYDVGPDGTTLYFDLIMPNAGNLLLDDHRTSPSLYDENLNPIEYRAVAASGYYYNLNAGSYIVKSAAHRRNSTKNTLTINC